MDVDHVRRALAVGEQRAPERAAGRAVAPEDVRVAPCEDPAGEERRLARREALLPVARVAPPEASRPVAPRVKAARDDADLVTGREQAEDEVVVLGPAGVAVAERAEHVASYHERRMRDGTLDERLCAEPRGAVDRVQPALVGAEPRGRRRAREDAHVAADGGEARGGVERRALRAEPIAVHDV